MNCVLEIWEAAATEYTGRRLAAGSFPRQQGHPGQIERLHYDGDWQFHGTADQSADESVSRIVALDQVVKLDEAVQSLHDLPYRWTAEWNSPGGE